MSSSIWMACAGVSGRRPLAVEAWRAVEAQRLLEELIESSKPSYHRVLGIERRTRFGGRLFC